MSESEESPTAVSTEQSILHLDPGEQALLTQATKDPPFDRLPPNAFDNLLVVSTALSPATIEQRLEANGHDPSSVGVVPITATEFRYDGPLWVSRRVAPSDLTGISIEVSRGFSHLEPARGWLTFDSISTLLMYADEERVYRLLAWLASNGRQSDIRGVFVLARTMLSDRTYNRLEGLWDTVVGETGLQEL